MIVKILILFNLFYEDCFVLIYLIWKFEIKVFGVKIVFLMCKNLSCLGLK